MRISLQVTMRAFEEDSLDRAVIRCRQTVSGPSKSHNYNYLQNSPFWPHSCYLLGEDELGLGAVFYTLSVEEYDEFLVSRVNMTSQTAYRRL